MHIRPVTRVAPEQAVNIEQVFDLIIQFVNVVTALESLFGFNVECITAALKGNPLPDGCQMP